MSLDRESTLRPLRAAAVDVDALRGGDATAGRVVRLARAAETVLRRLLRDDFTAPVELRLRALSADDLPTDELLAELRRRERIPLELAAAFHELHAAAARLGGGGELEPRDGALALSVAEGVERHVLALPAGEGRLEDPVAPADETLLPNAEHPEAVHPVPPAAPRPVWPWVAGALGLGLLVLALFLWWRGRGPDDLQAGEALLRRGRAAEAADHFRRYADRNPNDPLPRLYLARIYREGGQPDQAVRELRQGLRAAPDHAGLHTELGFLLLDGGRPAEAAERFREAVKLDAGSPRAWGGLVRALRQAGRPEDAEQVLRLAPPEVRALLARPDPAAAPP
ncbi:MAG TPA: tetratricopeptide repeat protein [Longimicrobiaceae bacterium]|nr:tetratricopeptide repeat protein [Longimicrobiaceae bacterium]